VVAWVAIYWELGWLGLELVASLPHKHRPETMLGPMSYQVVGTGFNITLAFAGTQYFGWALFTTYNI